MKSPTAEAGRQPRSTPRGRDEPDRPAPAAPRESGIPLVGDVPWGTHFCQFYETREDLLELVVPYFKAGLEQNEYCMWVTSEPLHADDARAALREAVPDLDERIARGQIDILDYRRWYTPSGKFEADSVLRGWVERERAARKSGYAGLRLSGNTFWLEAGDWRRFSDYEAAVDHVIGAYRMIALCTYSLARCGASEIIDVVGTHQFALIKQQGAWTTLESRERKRAAEALRESELRYRSLFENMLDGLALHKIIVDERGGPSDYVFLEVNSAFERLTGLRREEIVGRRVTEAIPGIEQDPADWIGIYGKVALTGRDVRFEQHAAALDRWFSIYAYSPMPEHFVTVFEDITDRKRAEQALLAACADMEERVAERTEELRAASLYARSLIEASLDPLVTISPKGTITDVNLATEEMTGVPRARLIGSGFPEYCTDPAKALEGFRKVLEWGFVRDYPLTIRHVSGRTTEVLYNATLYRDEAGRALGVFAAARDVTERNAAERRQGVTNRLLELFSRITSRREYLDSVVEVLRDWSGCSCLGIRILDQQERIPYEGGVGFSREFWTRESCLSLKTDTCACTRVVTGLPEPQDLGFMTAHGSFVLNDSREFAQRLSPPDLARFRGACIAEGFSSIAVVPLRYHEQTLGALHLADRRGDMIPPETVEHLETLSLLIGEAIQRFNAEAELGRHREHLEELVQQRTAQLRRTAAELERSNEDLERFAYAASHDLKEPLRAVAGYAGLLQLRYRGRLDAQAESYIDGTIDGAARMQRLIDDLLEYSRVGTIGPTRRPIPAQAALDRALANLDESIREAGATVTSDPLPLLLADEGQLSQLFQNLIGNALKFRGESAPVIRVGAQRQGKHWLLSVRDNGIGIEPAYRERIFEIFQRLHTRVKYPGTGIGLAICKRIVERHGGRIWVESQPGAGATFFFTVGCEAD